MLVAVGRAEPPHPLREVSMIMLTLWPTADDSTGWYARTYDASSM